MIDVEFNLCGELYNLALLTSMGSTIWHDFGDVFLFSFPRHLMKRAVDQVPVFVVIEKSSTAEGRWAFLEKHVSYG